MIIVPVLQQRTETHGANTCVFQTIWTPKLLALRLPLDRLFASEPCKSRRRVKATILGQYFVTHCLRLATATGAWCACRFSRNALARRVRQLRTGFIAGSHVHKSFSWPTHPLAASPSHRRAVARRARPSSTVRSNDRGMPCFDNNAPF